MKKPVKTEGTVKKEDLDALTRQMTQTPKIRLKDLKGKQVGKKKAPSGDK
jgi:hypothetical protein